MPTQIEKIKALQQELSVERKAKTEALQQVILEADD